MGDPEPLQDILARSSLLLTPEEAAIVLNIGRTKVYALMKAGDLRPVHIGRSCRLSRAELERYVRQLATPPQAVRTAMDEVAAARSSRRRTDDPRRRRRSSE
ncbi:helix-turn-helix domain-containing protein [Geodermatophilus poikilotrophus]|uniref:DNA binding domain-containing protein, excisionase family n=1 Tax=Geodermatophilus poikilotrophus TaxID=1333667 RepID=A0A1H9YEI1_9ACTN|nr:helix-turn-helix domain-containing protein [Geodermatophilus poikilotrophus]SES66977.1 DNA binding domain-containing protein, excisionase family [Geodermatophilus poikilotrophus]